MYEVIGIERIDYEGKNGRVMGYQVYFTYELPDDGGETHGRGCGSVYLRDAVFARNRVDVGSPAMPVFDQRGRFMRFVEMAP